MVPSAIPTGDAATPRPVGRCQPASPREQCVWRARDTQVLIRVRERLGFTPTEIAPLLRKPVAEIEERVAELVETGDLHANPGDGRRATEHRGLQFWNAVRPAIREMYEDREPRQSIMFMLGISATELGSQLQRLFREGLKRRTA
jgi:hypothetical protein